MAENLANELNRLAREDCDFLGGDGPAMLDLLDDYLGVPEEELSDDELPADNDQHYQEGKTTIMNTLSFNNNNNRL